MQCNNKTCTREATHRFNCVWWCYICYLKENAHQSYKDLKLNKEDIQKAVNKARV